jgi:predicted lipase
MPSSLSESQRRLYALEKGDNFRWVVNIFSKPSLYTITSHDLASLDLQLELSEFGQFAEVAHGQLSPEFIWENMDRLLQPRFPLSGYNALRQSELISVFHGAMGNYQGYIARRSNQLVVAFSGTSNIRQTFSNIDARLVSFPRGAGCAVHAGFWRIYNGVRTNALAALAEALQQHNVHEIIFTGHSLGAAMCYFMALEVMEETRAGDTSLIPSPTPAVLTVAVFGCPRAGNLALVQYWWDVVEDCVNHGLTIREYSVKGFNDGQIDLHPTPSRI